MTIRMGPGGEFDLIRRFLDAAGGELPASVTVEPGDDAAVLEEGFVVGSDLSIEDVHFRRSWLGVEEIGYRAVAAVLSDLAAMAARPAGVLLSVALGPADGGEVGVGLARGAGAAARDAGTAIIGGDTSRSPGPLVLDAVAVGRADEPLRRDGGRPGDELWVTGALGASAAAVRAWEAGEVPSARARERFVRPVPRLEEARWLVGEGDLRAGIDISDGLAADAGHLAAAGGVAAVLDAERIPVDPAARPAGDETARDLALRGGEDYELLVAAPPGALEERVGAFETRFRIPLTRVGRMEEGRGVWLRDGRFREELAAGGFDHFPGGGAPGGRP